MSAPISEIVSVTITADTAGVTQAGFGTPLLAAYTTVFPERVRAYSDLTEMVAAGFTAGSVIYRAAAAIFGQEPRVEKLKIGRRTSAPLQKTNFIPTNTTSGLQYKITITGPTGVAVDALYTVAPADTVALVIDGLVAAINALGLAVTCVDNTTSFDVNTNVAGTMFDFETLSPITVKNTTADAGIAADLGAIALEDNDWYGLALLSNSEAEVNAAAAWVEANGKMMAADSLDSDVSTSSSSDLGSDLKGASYARSALVTGASNLLSFAGAAALGKDLPTVPGTATLSLKTLKGVKVGNLNSTQRGYAKAKNVNYLSTVAGRNILREGVVASGQFWDVTRFTDYLTARIQENVLLVFLNNPKLTYSDTTVDIVKAEIQSVLQQNTPLGLLPGTIVVTGPKVADVPAATRATRRIPDIKFSAQLGGAAQGVTIAGKVVI